MAFSTLGTGLTLVTNPDPNTITTKPYAAGAAGKFNATFSPAWSALPQFALFPTLNPSGRLNERLGLHFIPSTPGATFTIVIWFFNANTQTWSKPANNSTVPYTGETMDYINAPPYTAIFPQISALSAGTLRIDYDSDFAGRG